MKMRKSAAPSVAVAFPRAAIAPSAPKSMDELIEAAWLTALIVVPLFFTQQAFTSFNPYKVVIIRLVGAVILAAWTIRAVNEKRSWKFTGALSRPICVALGVFLASQMISVGFSVSPRASVWGGVETWEGWITTLAEVAVFLAVACLLRHGRQLERLVNVIVAGVYP